MVLHIENVLDLLQGKTDRLRLFYELHALDRIGRIEPVICSRALKLRHESHALVEVQRLDVNTRLLGSFANLESLLHKPTLLVGCALERAASSLLGIDQVGVEAVLRMKGEIIAITCARVSGSSKASLKARCETLLTDAMFIPPCVVFPSPA